MTRQSAVTEYATARGWPLHTLEIDHYNPAQAFREVRDSAAVSGP